VCLGVGRAAETLDGLDDAVNFMQDRASVGDMPMPVAAACREAVDGYATGQGRGGHPADRSAAGTGHG
jgi:hypothetical protein